jgi:formate hydrogenlyase subunit 3/multisubunit Na+/H+ antiporter MnhD subunit
MLFRSHQLLDLAAVALLHLAGHAPAKRSLFLTADGLRRVTGSGGALFAAMSLAAMPPMAGFVSEWFVFQTVFQGFRLPNLVGRLVLALAGAGLALTAAIAFATFVKVFGIGVLGRIVGRPAPILRSYSAAVGFLGLTILALGAGMPVWLNALEVATTNHFALALASEMHDGLLLVPLTAKFAFISPSLLVIAMPLLSLVPVGLILGTADAPSVDPPSGTADCLRTPRARRPRLRGSPTRCGRSTASPIARPLSLNAMPTPAATS